MDCRKASWVLGALALITAPHIAAAVPNREEASALPDLPGELSEAKLPEEPAEWCHLLPIPTSVRFDVPVALAVVPGPEKQVVIAQQRGAFHIMRLDDADPRLFLDFRGRLKDLTLFEEGVHGIAFHQKFGQNGLFYIAYTQNEPRRTVISEMCVAADEPLRADPATERVLLEIPQPLADHWGGGIEFGPDGFLYIGLGDGGMRNDPYRLAQNPWVLHGKILRIDVDHRSGSLPYAIPADNPFVGKQIFREEIWALGFRNPWGMAFDVETGELWCADVGQDFWEEINLVHKGANYGWSDRDGPWPLAGHASNFLEGTSFVEPIHAYSRLRGEGACIIGGYRYRGTRLGPLHGCYLFADWALGTVVALEFEPGTDRPAKRWILHRRGEGASFNPTMVSADPDGEPIIMSQDGLLYRLGAVIEDAETD